MACDRPIYIKKHRYLVKQIPVPCGKCPPCKKRRVDQWVFRLKQEDKISLMSHFVTLTYSTDHVPISDNGFMTLAKKDFQNFIKRLRHLTNNNVKYYACGEYGTQNKRPHYHAIIFNIQAVQHYASAWCLNGVQLGKIDVGGVSGNSIAYTCKYMDKEKTIPLHSRDDRTKEFSLMSKGLGQNYLSPEIIKYHKENLDRLYLTTQDGNKIAMPKYYRQKIFSEDEKRKQIHIIKQALDEVKDEQVLQLQKKGIDYDDWKLEKELHRARKFTKNNTNKRTL